MRAKKSFPGINSFFHNMYIRVSVVTEFCKRKEPSFLNGVQYSLNIFIPNKPGTSTYRAFLTISGNGMVDNNSGILGLSEHKVK
jgi:hypothetical protein